MSLFQTPGCRPCWDLCPWGSLHFAPVPDRAFLPQPPLAHPTHALGTLPQDDSPSASAGPKPRVTITPTGTGYARSHMAAPSSPTVSFAQMDKM